MTKSTITDERVTSVIERLEHYACNLKWTNVRGAQDLLTAADGLRELQERRKADSEPVAYTDERNLGYIDLGRETAYLWGKQNSEAGDIQLYRHAQPAPEYPETLPCPVLLGPGLRFGKGVKTILALEAIQRRAEYYAELEAMPPEERAEYDAGIEAFKAMLPQSAPAVPEEATPDSIEILASARHREHAVFQWNEDQRNAAADSWNACRAAMLQAVTLTNEGNIQAVPQNAPQNIPEIIPGWIPVSERMPETDGNYWGWWSESKRQGPVWFIKSELQAQFQSSEITHWMPLPAAPQEVNHG
ncbi:TPA: DUF551 domain-containing protein [Klebsiella quasipneumoniae subsp. quasipneumoniae]|nr:DUF551 domain-containing protein [Klebsiella quasipneumoniae subsp. quasipneumoniae]